VIEISHPELQLQIGGPAGAAWVSGIPVLDGDSAENLFPFASLIRREGPFSLYRQQEFLIGVAQALDCADLVESAFQLYQDLFQVLGAKHLCRIWNYLPDINEPNSDGLEQYRAFCRGRAMAFESHFGRGFERVLPAASAVGTDSNRLIVAFAAHDTHPHHYENPLQTPAYQYPLEFGPRPPSFARASVVEEQDRRHVFISGTAAIRDHQSIAPNETEAQLLATLENLKVIMTLCGLPLRPGASATMQRNVKVYIRHASDLGLVAGYLSNHLLGDGDKVSYLRSDICRSDLNVEVEITVLNAQRL
jgi:enamine deaminase RidA (YjgF/YER057c/UK114 family)